MKGRTPTNGEHYSELENLRSRLTVAEETLQAIYNQEVDALVVNSPSGEQVFTLQGAETSYRLLVEAMNEGALSLTADGTVLYSNCRFAQMVQCPMERVVGSKWAQFFPPEMLPKLKRLLEDAGTHGSKGEFLIKPAHGHLLPAHLSARKLKLGDNMVISVLVTDVSDLRAAHKALHMANEQLESRVLERTRELAEANEVLRAEMRERRAAEDALAQAQAVLRQHADDLEKRVEERTARLRDTIAELEAFSYTVSHDLRAPLRSVQSFSQILMEECAGKLNAEELDYLQRVVTSANSLDRLIQDVLVYSRATHPAISVKPIALHKLVQHVIDNNPALQSPASVTIKGRLPGVLGHEPSLTQCIANLLENAVKFVPPDRAPVVVVRAQCHGPDARIWIEDNGIGIAERDRERIFKIFERVHAAHDYPGTGIGLSIVKRGVERMGGKVGVESELNQGSRFWMQLPLAKRV